MSTLAYPHAARARADAEDEAASWPRLRAGEVHVWQASLDNTVTERDQALLSEDELERASCYRFTRDRLRFMAGRARLRTLLGRYLDRDPASLVFAFGSHGKPRLVPAPGEAPLYFNVSHSDDVALFAVSQEGPLGVDVERVREIPDWSEIADSVFSTEEQARLRGLPEEGRMCGFFEAWTRQEAFLKATGEGLSAASPERDAQRRGYTLHPLKAPPGYFATLASAFEVTRIVFRHWPGDSAPAVFSTTLQP